MTCFEKHIPLFVDRIFNDNEVNSYYRFRLSLHCPDTLTIRESVRIKVLNLFFKFKISLLTNITIWVMKIFNIINI